MIYEQESRTMTQSICIELLTTVENWNSEILLAKKWNRNNTVGRPELQKFVGALAGQGSTKGIFITTSSFTKEAQSYKPQGVKLVKIDGEKLTQLMIEYGLGVTTAFSYEIKRIDRDYFNDLDD